MSADLPRLLFVIENGFYGGGEKVFSQLIRGLPADRFKIFCAAAPGGFFWEEVRDSCTFFPLDLSNRFDLRNVGRLAGFIRDNGIDLVHSQGARADFYAAFAASKTKTPVIATVAMPVEGFDVGFLRKKFYLALNSLAERKIEAFLTVSEVLKRQLAGHGIAPEKITVIPNPVDPRMAAGGYDAGRVIGEFGLLGRLVLAAAGRLEWQKGYVVLLNALAELRGRDRAFFDRIKCVIAGTGRLEADLKAKTAKLGLQGTVAFAGFRRDIVDLLGAADIFVMPSLAEGQPLALLEAMAMGKPVIASDIPAIAEIISDGLNGRLFRAGDASALAGVLASAASDAEALRHIGRSAAETAEKYSLAVFLSSHAEFYSKAVRDAAHDGSHDKTL